MAYNSIHTAAGLAALTQAEAFGTVINLPTMAVGDGNGNEVSPSESQTALVREVYRAAINRVYQTVGDPNSFVAEFIIPASVGGFTIRECGVFDADGTLFVVGNLPATYKPNSAEGAYADTVVRLTFKVGNADLITVQIDPSVAQASQQWVINNVTAGVIAPGGTTGQIWTKDSNADGDASWQDADTASVVVDTLEEKQTLSAGQTVVDLASLTTRGLVVYINGERLSNDQWTADLTDPTLFTLDTAAAGGEVLIAAQNEPTGSVPFPLVQSLNLSDVPSKPTARTNLDVYSKAESRQLSPSGLIGYFARNTAPTGWLKANGAAVSRTAYADLFAAIGTQFGDGDGFTTFTLPDLRGEFIRGWDDSRGVDGSRVFGTNQSQAFLSHTHGSTLGSVSDHQHGLASGSAGNSNTTLTASGTLAVEKTTEGDSGYRLVNNTVNPTAAATLGKSGPAGGHTHTLTINAEGGTETRPRNVSLLACIKY